VPCVNTTGEDIRLAHGALGAAAQREGSRARRGCVLSFLWTGKEKWARSQPWKHDEFTVFSCCFHRV